MTTITNNKLTDEKIKRRINAIEERRSASRDFWDGDYEYPENTELLALREYRFPGGYALVPIEPTEDMVIKGFESEPNEFWTEEAEWAKYAAMTGCQQAAHRAKLCWTAMIAAAPMPGDNS